MCTNIRVDMRMTNKQYDVMNHIVFWALLSPLFHAIMAPSTFLSKNDIGLGDENSWKGGLQNKCAIVLGFWKLKAKVDFKYHDCSSGARYFGKFKKVYFDAAGKNCCFLIPRYYIISHKPLYRLKSNLKHIGQKKKIVTHFYWV